MRHFLVLFLLTLIAFPVIAQQNTKLIVRAKAKDAKFIGSSIGGAFVMVKNADTDEILAKGLTEGSTGNTGLIMSAPHERYMQLSDDRTARFETSLSIEEPMFLTIEVHSPYTHRSARVVASTQVWLIPGKDIIHDGIVLEIPGFIIDILNPHTHRFLEKADLKDGFLNVEANIVMMCGCTISKGGLWDGTKMDVQAILKWNGQKVGEYLLEMTDTANLFSGKIPLSEGGNYEIIVYAFDPETGNTGVEKVNFILE